MSCIITYKGQKYSEEQFKEYFINNKQEFATSIAKNKDVMDSFKRKMEGIDFVFSQSPELASIGSKVQYLQYLSTIFPDSKVKDIVYHTTYQEFKGDKFNKPSEQSLAKGADDGIYFSKDPNYYTDKGNKIASILDLKTPMEYSHGIFMNAIDASGYRKVEGSDGFITYIKEAKADLDAIKPQFPDIDPNDFSEEELKEIGNNYQKELDNWKQLAAKKELVFATVFEPEQIHVMGGKNDIQGFKDFTQGKQFQKLTAEEKAKTIKQITKEHRSITALKDLAAKLAHRIGGKVEFVNNPNVDWKGYRKGMTFVLNETYMTSDTPFHEVAHMIIQAIKYNGKYNRDAEIERYNNMMNDYWDKHPNKSREEVELYMKNNFKELKISELYQSLLKELETGRGKEIFEQVKRDYQYKENKIYTIHESEDWGQTYYDIVKIGEKLPDLSKEREGLTFKNKDEALKRIEELNPKVKYTLEEQQEEAIVTLLGMMAADKLDAKKDATLISKLKALWKQISDFVKSLLKQDGIKIDELPITTTLNDLAEIMAYGNNKIILPGYKIEYSTPLGNKYDTLEEVNNEIRGLADADVEVDLSDIKENLKSFDSINHFTVSNYNFYKENGKWYEDSMGFPMSFDEDYVRKQYEKTSLEGFIEKNKEYEQSKEIIEQWKKKNNIQYDPEEVYSRGQGFYSSIGAYSNLELDLLLKNLIQHIQDNKKAGGEFTISAFTKPIDKRLKHIEGTGDRVRFVIYPKSEHIKWAAPTDVFSGSVWDAHEKVSKDKKSELLGVSFTKAPALRNINEVSPNLADIIDNLSHAHNELGIELTTNNFRIEYDDNIDYSTKKLIDNVNKILDDKYGKLEKPEIKTSQNLTYWVGETEPSTGEYYKLKTFNSLKEAQDYTNQLSDETGLPVDYWQINQQQQGKQPTQTNETLSKSINTISIENDILGKYMKDLQEKRGLLSQEKSLRNHIMENLNKLNEIPRDPDISTINEMLNKNGLLHKSWHFRDKYDNDTKQYIHSWGSLDVPDYVYKEALELDIKTHLEFWGSRNLNIDEQSRVVETLEKEIRYLEENEPKEKEYTSQANINLKVAALKEVVRKYPRSLITSKVVPISPNMVNSSEIQYSKVGSKQDIENFAKFVNSQQNESSNVQSILNSNNINELAKQISEINQSNNVEDTNKSEDLSELQLFFNNLTEQEKLIINSKTSEEFENNFALRKSMDSTLTEEEYITELEECRLGKIKTKPNIKAEKGLSTSFSKGGKWSIVKELKGATHAEGGIDLTIGKDGVRLRGNGNDFYAKNGLVIKAQKNNYV